jgi:hypothetical protein
MESVDPRPDPRRAVTGNVGAGGAIGKRAGFDAFIDSTTATHWWI